MATFAKGTFNAARYAASRPTYPKQLFDFIFKQHESYAHISRWDLAVDLGCGTGQATTELTRFKRVIGVEPSAVMIEGARQHIQSKNWGTEFDFVQAPAEELGFLKDGSVDLVVAAQAAHWFDWSKLWPQIGRVLRANGTGAFWIYSQFRLPEYPLLTPKIHEYSQGSDPKTSLGPYWEQPGRSILDKHLIDIPEPPAESKLSNLERIYFTGSYYENVLPASSTRPVILRNPTTWNGVYGYLRTWSPLHTFLERNPDDANNENGDLAYRFWISLMEQAAGTKDIDVVTMGEEKVTIEWPVALLIVHKPVAV